MWKENSHVLQIHIATRQQWVASVFFFSISRDSISNAFLHNRTYHRGVFSHIQNTSIARELLFLLLVVRVSVSTAYECIWRDRVAHTRHYRPFFTTFVYLSILSVEPTASELYFDLRVYRAHTPHIRNIQNTHLSKRCVCDCVKVYQSFRIFYQAQWTKRIEIVWS